MRIESLGASVAWLAAIALITAASPARAEDEPELEQLRRAIRDSRERVTRYEREQRGLLETVEALDRSAAAIERDLVNVRRVSEQARKTLKKVEAEAAEIRERRKVLERAMSGRAVALYKAGTAGPVRLLFAADGVRDLLSRLNTLKLLLGHDIDLLERHRIESAALVEAEVRAREALEGRDEALATLRERSDQLKRERAVKRKLVARLHTDRASERAALVELETAARALEETLASLRKAPARRAEPEGPSFASLREKLAPPVEAPIAESFGRVVDAEFKTETFRSGVEFDAPLGAAVEAVAAGQVRFAGWFRGYGKLVILDHGDEYFTVSGHLADIRVKVGDEVEPRGVIGTVGDTGSLSGPRLYFEVRHGREPQDPRKWLHLRDTG
ncbi:MAG: peptidoglycan DD-metalloendopeptidase family protein [Deltaproteobacteria bacterium]|nr:peptidoglycan DD-metalloendopeptidase family protein [Deltaproteobacteria bacterium]MBW2691361.1 peptidoglycan DD-metalloendopeptidase family protein [Deltaproteobacteria bacterium]